MCGAWNAVGASPRAAPRGGAESSMRGKPTESIRIRSLAPTTDLSLRCFVVSQIHVTAKRKRTLKEALCLSVDSSKPVCILR
jgi:hypothetical protein